MKSFARIACFICCISSQVAGQQNNASSLNPWDIKEIGTFHTIFHRLATEYYEREDCGVLLNASGEFEAAFEQLQHARLPEQLAARANAYAVFVDSMQSALDQYRKAKRGGNCENLKAAFLAFDETFELAVPRLRRMLNAN